MSEAVEVDCPAYCRYRDVGHLHVEFEDGYGEVISPTGAIIEPFDLGRPARVIYLSGQPLVPVAETPGCVRHSWGVLHVKPGCRCRRPRR